MSNVLRSYFRQASFADLSSTLTGALKPGIFQANNKAGSIKLYTATFLLLFYVTLLLVITTGFFISSDFIIHNSFVVSLGVSVSLVAGHLRGSRESSRVTVATLVAGLSIIAAAIFVSELVYDISWDGQSYHSQEMFEVATGWNPFREELDPTVLNRIFIQHYPKSYSYAGSAIYLQLGVFEGAKALNILLLVSSYLLVLDILGVQVPSVKARDRHIIALLLACNPITIFQLFTFYVDGQLSSVCLILFSSIFLFRRNSIIASAVFACAVILLVNLKFTGLVYAVMACAYGLVFIFRHKRQVWRHYLIVAGCAFLIAVCWVGYNPYIRNVLEKSHVFYPLMGKNSLDIMKNNPDVPEGFVEKNSMQRLFESTFSRSKNIHNTPSPAPEFKMPFTFKLREWIVFKSHSILLGGFGPLWSGILLLMVVFVPLSIVKYNKLKLFNADYLLLSLALLSLVFINPEGWLSRYVPFFWFVPALAVLFLLFQNVRMAYVLGGVMFVNLAGTSLVSIASDAIVTSEIKNQVAWLKQYQDDIRVNFRSFDANKVRMLRGRVPFSEITGEPLSCAGGNCDSLKIQNSQTVVYFNRSLYAYAPGPLFGLLAGYTKSNIHEKDKAGFASEERSK